MVALQVEEHVMVSGAAGYRDGVRVWSLLHDPEEDPDHLETDGDPPPEFAAVLARHRAEAADADDDVDSVFDIPVDLAKAITGYRHDDLHEVEPAFTAAKRIGAAEREQPRRPGLFSRLFGRRD